MSAPIRGELRRLWLREFTVGGRCGLCGNTGKIDTSAGLMMPNGQRVPGGVFFCICPDGRKLKRIS